jgi:hypothetical protein
MSMFRREQILSTMRPHKLVFKRTCYLLYKTVSQVMGSNVVGSIDNHKPGEVTHDIHTIRVTVIVGDITGGPKVYMENVEGAAGRPGEDELAVASHSAIVSNAVGALKAPIGDFLATSMWPKESHADLVEGIVDTHMSSSGGDIVSREDV